MEDARRVSADPETQEHITQLGDRRVSEDLLEVVLCDANRSGKH